MAATNFNVYFYNFTKKVNSTRTPVNGTEGLLWEVHTCYLRSPSSIIAPVLEMSFNRNQYGGDGGVYNENIGEAVLEYNYAYIPRFNRYYFINNVSWDNGMFILNLRCDVLGTYKEKIGNYKGFVLRSSAASNSMIEDTFRTVTKVTGKSDVDAILYTNSPTYILGCACSTSVGGGYGGLTYFAASESSIGTVIETIANGWGTVKDNTFTRATEEEIAVLKPLDMIKSLSVIPFTPENSTENATAIYYNGYTRLDITGLPVLKNLTYDFKETTITFLQHDQINTLPYTAFSPYSQHFIYLPGVGEIKLNSDEFLGGVKSCKLIGRVDLISGTVQYKLSFATGMYTYEGKLGIGGSASAVGSTGAISAVQVTGDIVQGALGAVSIAAGIVLMATGAGAVVGAGMTLTGGGMIAGSITTGIGHAAGKSSNYSTTVGSSGTRSNIYGSVYHWSIFKNVSDINNKTMGSPLCAAKKISDIPGYIFMKDASVDIAGTDDEMRQVNYYLNTGFYYEEDVTEE